MWAQAANDLTPRELKTLESLVVAEIRSQERVKIVPANYPEDLIAVVVVAAKLPNGSAGRWYIASSVIIVATKKGTDELVTHDVVARGQQCHATSALNVRNAGSCSLLDGSLALCRLSRFR